jgi:hypothetical protein
MIPSPPPTKHCAHPEGGIAVTIFASRAPARRSYHAGKHSVLNQSDAA